MVSRAELPLETSDVMVNVTLGSPNPTMKMTLRSLSCYPGDPAMYIYTSDVAHMAPHD